MALFAGASPVDNEPTDVPVEVPPTTTAPGDADADGSQADGDGQALRVVDRGDPVSGGDARPATIPLPTAAPGETGVLIVNTGSRRCLDTADVTKLIQWSCHGDPQQRVMVEPVTDDPAGVDVYLRLQSTDQCLDVAVSRVGATDCDGGDTQIFAWTGTELRTDQRTCLTVDGTTVEGGALADSAPITAQPCDGSSGQQFVAAEDLSRVAFELQNVTPSDPSLFTTPPTSELMIKNVESQLCVDFAGQISSPVIQFVCHDGENQRFHQIPIGDGFALQLISTDRCLDGLLPVFDVMPCTGSQGQIFEWSSSSLVLQELGGACLTIDSGSLEGRARVVTAPCDGSASQQFVTASRSLEAEPASVLVTRILDA